MSTKWKNTTRLLAFLLLVALPSGMLKPLASSQAIAKDRSQISFSVATHPSYGALSEYDSSENDRTDESFSRLENLLYQHAGNAALGRPGDSLPVHVLLSSRTVWFRDELRAACLHDESLVFRGPESRKYILFRSLLPGENISQGISNMAHQQLRMADEIESISDYLIVILKSDLKMRQCETPSSNR